MEMNRKPNENGEFYLDVVPVRIDGKKRYAIYDLTRYFDAENTIDRRRKISMQRFVIVGKFNTIHISDVFNMLTEDSAKRLAIAWYTGEVKYHDYKS